MSETETETETEQAEADPQERVEFTIPSLLDSLSQNLHRLLEPNGLGFMVVITTKVPDESDGFPFNYATTLEPVNVVTMLRSLAEAIEKKPKDAVSNITADEMATALAALGADASADELKEALAKDTKSG